MTTAGWIFLTVSWTLITWWTVWSLRLVFKHERRKNAR